MTDEPAGFWIRTEPTIDGKAYVVTLSLSDDFSMTLTPIRATAYAGALLAAVAQAEYDHAILRQFREKLGVGDDVAAQMILDVRRDRPRLEAVGLAFIPGVSVRLQHPYIQVNGRDGTEYGQLDAHAGRRHALGVLEAVPAADLDAGYYRALRSLVNLDEARAREVVEDIGAWRQEWMVSER